LHDHAQDDRSEQASMIVENENRDDRNEHQWDFQDELVAPIPEASSWQHY
jgi:hypothetical protein